MVIDAMDLLYSNRFDGFRIVFSDSGFTRLPRGCANPRLLNLLRYAIEAAADNDGWAALASVGHHHSATCSPSPRCSNWTAAAPVTANPASATPATNDAAPTSSQRASGARWR